MTSVFKNNYTNEKTASSDQVPLKAPVASVLGCVLKLGGINPRLLRQL